MSAPNHRDRAIDVARRQGVARGYDFDAAGVPRVYLQRLRDEGVLLQVGRGLYRLADGAQSESASLAEAARIQPRGVVALLSALQFHELTTQTPHAVWMLLGPKDWASVNASLSFQIVRASGPSLTEGVDHHRIEGVQVPITSPSKTVIDCFKYRTRVGQDVAIEALRDLVQARPKRTSIDELWRFAAIDRVQSVVRPYLEALA